MQKGAIAQAGTPREIYFKPKNRFVAEFIGAANIIGAPGGHPSVSIGNFDGSHPFLERQAHQLVQRIGRAPCPA